MKSAKQHFFKILWGLLKGYWQSPEKNKAFLLLGILILLILGNVYIAVLLNEWKNAFYSALQNYDSEAVLAELYRFMVLAGIYTAIAVYSFYLEHVIGLNWRRWLTGQFLDRWTHRNNYYYLQVFDGGMDNPDQRISEDVRLFVTLTMTFTVGLLGAAASFVCFVALLWYLSGIISFTVLGINIDFPGYIVWIAFLYAFVGTWLTNKVGRKLVRFNVDQQRYEANFRYSMMRIRENAECVAFYRGGTDERRSLKTKLTLLLANYWKIIQTEKHLTGIKSAYFQMANIFPVLVAVPRYIIKEINLGGLMQTASAFTRVQRSLSYFLEFYTSFAEWRAVIERLNSFNLALGRAEDKSFTSGLNLRESTDNQIKARNLNIALPDGRRILENLDFTLRPGENVLIKGANGSGKSTLLRALAGIWPFGQGDIEVPAADRTVFISQRAYLPLGTLREILLYPGYEVHEDKELLYWLKECGIEHLAKYLDLEADWYQVFSMGEQQRLALARAFIQKPQWLFMDESTSAMDEDSESMFYSILEKKLPETTVVSIGHRNTLSRFHRREFRLSGQSGAWE